MNINKELNTLINSPYFYGFLAMFLGLYGPRLSPKLPKVITDLFGNKIFRFVFLLLIVYMSNNNLQMALIITIAFLLLTSYSTNQNIEEFFENKYKENFSDFDAITEFYNEEFDNIEEFQNFEQPEEFDKMPKMPEDDEAFQTKDFNHEKDEEFASTLQNGENIESFSSCQSSKINDTEEKFSNCGKKHANESFENFNNTLNNQENFVNKTVEKYKFNNY
jgi:hypothetical protein